MSGKKRVVCFFLVLVLLMSSCGEVPEDRNEEQAALNEGKAASARESGAEDAPLSLTQGEIRIARRGWVNPFIDELVNRFNRSHSGQIRLVAVDEASEWEDAVGEADMLLSNDVGYLKLLGANSALFPLDRLVGEAIEKGDCFPSVVDAGRVDGSLFVLTPFFTCFGMCMPRKAVEEKPEIGQSIRGLSEWLFSRPDQSFWRHELFDTVSCLSGMHGDQEWIDPVSLTCDLGGEDFQALFELAEKRRQEETTHDGEGEPGRRPAYLYCDPCVTATECAFPDGEDGEEGILLPFPTGKGFTVGSGCGVAVASGARHLGTVRDFLLMLLSEEVQHMETTAPPMSPYVSYMEMPLSREAFMKVLQSRYASYCDIYWSSETAPNRDRWIEECVRTAENADHYEASRLFFEAITVAYWEAVSGEASLSDRKKAIGHMEERTNEALDGLRKRRAGEEQGG